VITPYRGEYGGARPAALGGLPLPPDPMPWRRGSRPLKQWRYVGVYGPDLMLCVGSVRLGPLRQEFWAVWDRAAGRLHERTRRRHHAVELPEGSVRVNDGDVRIDLDLDEGPGIESVCPSGTSYAWTRKQGGVAATGTVTIDGTERRIDARAVVDDSAGYHTRHVTWHWSAGVGTTTDGRPVAWNLVEGINDPASASERSVWIAGVPEEPGPSDFAEDLSRVDGLTFHQQSIRERNENYGLLRSRYRQPFGTFSGRVPTASGPGPELAEAYGVMEFHDAFW
jgi:Protein of unknown function (DUF2804)